MEVHGDDAIDGLRLPIRLRMEGRTHVQACPRGGKQSLPKARSENHIPVRNDGCGKPMKSDNVGEEGFSNRLRSVRMRQGDEMRILGETVHNGQYHTFAAHLRKCLNEIHGDVFPHTRGHCQGLQ